MSHKIDNKDQIVRGTGLLVIEVINSNPNGDPDRESDPRQRPDERGEISAVSFKRKIRDLVQEKDGPVWECISKSFESPLDPDQFCILENRARDRPAIIKEIADGTFMQKYWDARLFGNTFLEEGLSKSHIKTGVAQFGMGVSVAPILIERITTTNPNVEEDKDQGMAPLAYRVVQHAVYCMPFFVNPTAAKKSGCQKCDIELLLRTIPYAYAHTASYVRPFVGIRHAWYMEHKSALGSCSDFELISALAPRKKTDPERPSYAWEEYKVPTVLPDILRDRIGSFRDLMNGD
jgi:CRISPR-associated protein Csd2